MAGELVPSNAGEFLIYQTEDGQTRVQVRFEGETVWLSQRDMAELFQSSKQNISLHIQNLYDEGELRRDATVKEYLTVQTEGSRQVERRVEHYNLDVILSVGYRVRSHRGDAVPKVGDGPIIRWWRRERRQQGVASAIVSWPPVLKTRSP